MKNRGVLGKIEDKLGLPPLGSVAEVFQKFPDIPKLKLIKSILEICEHLPQGAPELERVVTLVNLIVDTPIEKLENLERVLKEANKLAKQAPSGLLEFLSSLKEE